MLLSLMLLLGTWMPGQAGAEQSQPQPRAAIPVEDRRPSERLPERGKASLRAAAVDQMMRNFLREHGVPGASLAIAKDGNLLYARGFGWADPEQQQPVRPEARFRIASLSKPLTAVAILQLVQAEKLDLQANPFALIGYAEQLDAEACDPRMQDITVLHLLQHRGGWDRQQSFDAMFIPNRVQERFALNGPPQPHDIIRFMLEQKLDFDPGTRYAYSNFGYSVLGRVIETVTGKPYGEAMHEMVFQPLQLKSFALGKSLPEQRLPQEVCYQDRKQRERFAVTAPDRKLPIAYQHDQEVLDAHGGWVANASDLALFAGAFAELSESPLLDAEQAGFMWQRPPGAEGAVWYGCGWSVRELSGERGLNAWHSGLLSGGTSTLMVRRHDGYSWAVLFNTDRSSKTDAVLSGLIDPLIHRAVNQVETWKAED